MKGNEMQPLIQDKQQQMAALEIVAAVFRPKTLCQSGLCIGGQTGTPKKRPPVAIFPSENSRENQRKRAASTGRNVKARTNSRSLRRRRSKVGPEVVQPMMLGSRAADADGYPIITRT